MHTGLALLLDEMCGGVQRGGVGGGLSEQLCQLLW